MDNKKMQELMIDYIDGKLTGELKTFVEKHINKSIESKREFDSLKDTIGLLKHDKDLQPRSAFKSQFINELENIIDNEEGRKSKILKLRYVGQIAAAIVLLAVAFIGGKWMAEYNRQSEDITALKKELTETKELVKTALKNNSTPSERMQAVNASYNIEHVDNEVVEVLIETMNKDDNVNVRLAAINALVHFSEDEEVKKALINSLPKQTEPIVQITLINIMVGLKENRVLDQLNNIIQDSTIIQSVKDEAHMAVFKLS